MKKSLFLVLPVLLLLGSCDKQKDQIDYPGSEPIDDSWTFQPIDDSGANVRFYLRMSPDDIRAKIGGMTHVFTEMDSVYSRSVNYTPKFENGIPYLDIPSSRDHNYKMFCYPDAQKDWFKGQAPISGLMFPFGQMYGKTIARMASYPLYAEYKEETGNAMMFNEVYGVLDVVVKGSGNVASVHLLNKSKDVNGNIYMAGAAEFDPSRGYVVKKGVNFLNLNCTNEGAGVALSSEGTHFHLVCAPGNYEEGFELTVTDMTHKGQVFTVATEGVQVKAGEITELPAVTYSPDPSLIIFEHFDNFVWGACVRDDYGIISSYAPDDKTNLDDDPTARGGDEEAITEVANTTAGSALFQSSYTQGYTVATRSAVSRKYLTNRNLLDYQYLYRCSECQGCMSCGANDGVRALIDLKDFSKDFKGLYRLTFDFDISLRYGSQDPIQLSTSQSGKVVKVIIDGKELELVESAFSTDHNNSYNHNFLNCLDIKRTDIPAPKDRIGEEAGWHHMTIIVDNVSETTGISLQGFSTESTVKHGFYIDNLEVRCAEMPRGNLRVLYYNIQDGMWADQPQKGSSASEGFKNFVEWVKRWNPDVCVWCEARSLYFTDSYDSMSDNDRYLCKTKRVYTDAGWTALAKRYGHTNVQISGFCDSFPQVITSRDGLNIKVVNRLEMSGSKPNIIGPEHGAGHFQITVGGKTVNIVTLHLWPHRYSPNDDDRVTSEKNLNGRDFEKQEMQYILNNTINKVSGDYWLMMGDHNAISRENEDYYSYFGHYQDYKATLDNGEPYTWPGDTFRQKWYLATDVILNSKKYKDIIQTRIGPGNLMTSTNGAGRIDYMWASPLMYEKVVNALTPKDSWTGTIYTKTYSNGSLCVPSDHRPILVDFQL